MAVPLAFELCLQFDVHRFDSLLAEMLSRHRSRHFCDLSVPLAYCVGKRGEKLLLSLVCSVDLLDDLPSWLEVFEDVSCLLELSREPLADRSKPGFDAK